MKATRQMGGRTGGGLKWWHGMAAGMLLMLSPGSALLLLVLSAPVALVVPADTSPGRVLTRTVGLFLLAGMIGPLHRFVSEGHDLAAAFLVLGHPATILLTWLLGACGWLTMEAFSLLADLVINHRHALETRALQARVLEIRTEWELPAAEPAADQP